MLTFLERHSPFPDPSLALVDPDGLLAAGGDLSSNRLISAYSQGIFPWFSEGEPILWWSPNQRVIFETADWHPSRSLCRLIRQSQSSSSVFKVTVNHCFSQVMQKCSEPRKDQPTTWISEEMKQAYTDLHQRGFAHSLEVWQSDQLVGGIYGVAIGQLFCGESMFSRVTNGSKIALACLISYLRGFGFPLIDCQVENPHLMSLGANIISRADYLKRIEPLITMQPQTSLWKKQTLPVELLVTRNFNDVQ